VLPTFNSFAIQSFLDRLPGLSRRFFCFDDDVLLAAPVTLQNFVDREGRLRVFRRLGRTAPAALRHAPGLAPWSAALAHTNYLLDQAFGAASRLDFAHVPLLIDQTSWGEMIERWRVDFAHTRASRFRGHYNVVPDYLYPQFMLATGRGVAVPLWRCYRELAFHKLGNNFLWAWCGLAGIGLIRPKAVGLNDDFGRHPNPSVVALARRFLERRYPVKSPFEI
jgi:hypothetical protein